MKALVTGDAGFIGSRFGMLLLERGDDVVDLDNMRDHYHVDPKEARLARFTDPPSYTHFKADLAGLAAVEAAIATHRPQRIVELAACESIGPRF